MIWMIGYGHPLLDGRIHHREAIPLVEAGMAVTVVARKHPSIQVGETTDGVQHIELPPLHPSLWVQMLLTPWYWLTLYVTIARRARYGDVFVAHEHQSLSLAWFLKKRFRGKAVYDSHEDWPENFSHSVSLILPWARRSVRYFMKHYEALFTKGMDAIVIAQPIMFEDSRLDREKSFLYPNRPLEGFIGPDGDVSAEVQKAIKGKRVLLFLGYVGPRAGSLVMLKMMEVIHQTRQDVILIMAGKIVPWHENELRKTIQRLGVESQILLTGMFTASDVPGLLRVAEIAMSLQQDEPAHYQRTEVTKYFQYAAGGVPQIATEISAHFRLQDEGSPALLVPCDDGTAAAKAILSLLDRPDQLQALGEASLRCFHEHWSLDRYMEGFLDLYRGLVASGENE